jgi:uncharacterized protein
MRDPALQATHRLQLEFAAHLRAPDRHPAPDGVPSDRLSVYRELLYHNVENFLSASFPVLRATVEPQKWHSLAAGFFRDHRSKSPYPAEVGEEFLAYLQYERTAEGDDPPFLLELAHYEWVELALLIGEEEPPAVDLSLSEIPWNRSIRLSELAWPLAYRFPVHRIGPGFRPVDPPADVTLLAVYRGRDDRVRFLELGSQAYRLLVMLQQEGPLTAAESLARLGITEGRPSEQAVELLQDLATRAIIGTV